MEFAAFDGGPKSLERSYEGDFLERLCLPQESPQPVMSPDLEPLQSSPQIVDGTVTLIYASILLKFSLCFGKFSHWEIHWKCE